MSKEIEELQGEVKILKNEIREILVGIKEYLVTAPQNDDSHDDEQARVSRKRSVSANDGDDDMAERPSRNNYNTDFQMPPPVQQAQGGTQMPPAWAQQAPGGIPPQWWPQPQAPSVAQQPLSMPPLAVQQAPQPLPMPPQAVQQAPQPLSMPPQAVQQAQPGTTVQVMDKPVADQQRPIEQAQTAAEVEPARPAQVVRETERAAAPAARAREQETEAIYSKNAWKSQAKGIPKEADGKEETGKPVRYADEAIVIGAIDSGCPGPQVQKDETMTFTSVALLAPWVEGNIRKLGKEKLKSLVKLYAEMGQIKNAQRDFLLRLIGLEGEVAPTAKATLRESMRALAELDNLMAMSKHDEKGAAILSMYLNGIESNNSKLPI